MYVESVSTIKSLLNSDGFCTTCDKSGIGCSVTCFMCLKKFHAINCSVPSNICTQTYLNSFTPLSEKTGVNDQRPGNFKFICDICMTKFEKKQARNTSDEFTSLQNQVNKLDESMKDIKKLLMNSNTAGNNINHNITVPIKQTSCWGKVPTEINSEMPFSLEKPNAGSIVDSTGSENKSILVIENKDNTDSKKEALNMVEKVVVDCNIGIKNSYDNKQGNTVVVCHSDEQRNILETKIKEALPDIAVKSLNNYLNNSIAVVGFNPTYDSSTILDTILKQNAFANDFIKLKSNGNIGNHIQLLYVKPLKNNVNLSQAVFKVSSAFRSLLKSKNDKLLVGIRSVTVYERVFVKRCFGCQKYGHINSHCPTPDVKVCANCAGDHETKNCDISKEKNKCANCQRHGTSNSDHAAYSSDCPVFRAELVRVKNLN